MISVTAMLERAQECREKAQTAKSEDERVRWQELADAWTQLAGEGVVTPPGPGGDKSR